MTLWLDAQLSPALAPWFEDTFPDVHAFSLKRLGLRDATDGDVFMAARSHLAVVVTKG